MLPTQFRFIWLSGYWREDFLEIDQLKQELPMAAMFVSWTKWTVCIEDFP
jgi:hypothetical protein